MLKKIDYDYILEINLTKLEKKSSIVLRSLMLKKLLLILESQEA